MGNRLFIGLAALIGIPLGFMIGRGSLDILALYILTKDKSTGEAKPQQD